MARFLAKFFATLRSLSRSLLLPIRMIRFTCIRSCVWMNCSQFFANVNDSISVKSKTTTNVWNNSQYFLAIGIYRCRPPISIASILPHLRRWRSGPIVGLYKDVSLINGQLIFCIRRNISVLPTFAAPNIRNFVFDVFAIRVLAVVNNGWLVDATVVDGGSGGVTSSTPSMVPDVFNTVAERTMASSVVDDPCCWAAVAADVVEVIVRPLIIRILIISSPLIGFDVDTMVVQVENGRSPCETIWWLLNESINEQQSTITETHTKLSRYIDNYYYELQITKQNKNHRYKIYIHTHTHTHTNWITLLPLSTTITMTEKSKSDSIQSLWWQERRNHISKIMLIEWRNICQFAIFVHVWFVWW